MSNSNCQICDINTGKYSCPQCNTSYCSVECYQSKDHKQCSESFYKKWVQQELKNCESDSEQIEKMVKILKKNQCYELNDEDLDSDDLEEEPDLATRMLNVNLDDEKAIWEKLTAEEKHEFRKLVANGDIIKVIPNWEPWWKIRKQKLLIQDLDNDDMDITTICPSLPLKIPEIKSLSKAEPSPSIVNMVFNILACYTCMLRWFKGTHKEMPVEAISTFLCLCGTLKENQIFNNLMEAFNSLEDNFLKCKWLQRFQFHKREINEDVKDIVNGSYKNDSFFCIKAALNDLDSTICYAVKVLKDPKTQYLKRFSGNSPKISQLLQASKKITYYLAWTVSYGTLLVTAVNSFT